MSWQANASAEVICSIAHHYYIRRGFDIIEVSDDTQFLDGNIERLTEPKQDKLILRACSMGEPSRIIQKVGSEERNAIQVNDKVYIP